MPRSRIGLVSAALVALLAVVGAGALLAARDGDPTATPTPSATPAPVAATAASLVAALVREDRFVERLELVDSRVVLEPTPAMPGIPLNEAMRRAELHDARGIRVMGLAMASGQPRPISRGQRPPYQPRFERQLAWAFLARFGGGTAAAFCTKPRTPSITLDDAQPAWSVVLVAAKPRDEVWEAADLQITPERCATPIGERRKAEVRDWVVDRSFADGIVALVLRYDPRPCEALVRTTVAETATRVVATIVVSVPDGTGTPPTCPSPRRGAEATIRLRAPLGDRELVVGKTAPVTHPA